MFLPRKYKVTCEVFLLKEYSEVLQKFNYYRTTPEKGGQE
nr:hypothetical protein [Mucilaginibacter sp. X4EP1]